MTLCPYKQMDKCALQFCDFYNKSAEMCALALAVHEKVALLEKVNNILERIERENHIKATEQLQNWLSKVDKTLFQ